MKQFIDYVKVFVLKSWKTTIAGIALFIIGYLVNTGKITEATATTIVTVLTGLGFIASKDANKSTPTP
jgi:uncharacterized membrane protein (DUF4010 family)